MRSKGGGCALRRMPVCIKFVQALLPEAGDPDLPANNADALDADAAVAALQTAAKRRNDIAMAQFTMAL